MMFEMLCVTAYLAVVAMLFVMTLDIIKQYGFIRCSITMVVLLSVLFICTYILNSIIAYFLIKILMMWIVVA